MSYHQNFAINVPNHKQLPSSSRFGESILDDISLATQPQVSNIQQQQSSSSSIASTQLLPQSHGNITVPIDHGHYDQQIYQPPPQNLEQQQVQLQPTTYLNSNGSQDYGYVQVNGNMIPGSMTVSSGDYNSYIDCTGANIINTVNYQVVNTSIIGDNNQYHNGNYVDPAQTINYGYVDNGLTTNFTTQVPGYNPFLGARGERSASTTLTSTTGNMIIANSNNSNTNMSSSNMKDDSKPVKAKRKKKVTRKKEPTANKKSASAYAHFFRDVQARIKEVNKSASFGDISKIVAQEWEALSIDEKAVYKRKAENEKNEQFKDIALSRAMAVAGAKLSNNMSELDNNQTLYSNPLQETSIAQYNGNDHFLGNESVSMISYQQHPFQQQPIS